MSVLSLIFLLLVGVDTFIFDVELLVADDRECLEHNWLILPLNNWSLHIFRSGVAIDLATRGSFGQRVVLVELLLELEIFLPENIPNFSVGQKLAL